MRTRSEGARLRSSASPSRDDHRGACDDASDRLLELAEKTLRLTGSTLPLIHGELPADDPRQRQPDISLARQRLGWEPTVQLREGLLRTIEWFRTINLDDYRPPTPNY